MKQLIQLAKAENPDADIVYRPHPDVYKGFQRSKFLARTVENICTVVNPDIPVSEFLGSVDHVYTITSLTGLEALLHGIKVTVVGAAFYGGWGLTDDRVAWPRHRRARSLEELFAAIYLKYPRYLGNVDDAFMGFNVACMAIKADQEAAQYREIQRLSAVPDSVLNDIAVGPHWPQIFFRPLDDGQRRKTLAKIDFGRIFMQPKGPLFPVAFCYAMAGQCKDNTTLNLFLTLVRKYLDLMFFGMLLHDLSKVRPGQYLAIQYSWLLSAVREPEAALQVLLDQLTADIAAQSARMAKVDQGDGQGDETEVERNCASRMTAEQADLQLAIFEHEMLNRDFSGAVATAKDLLLNGFFAMQLLPRLAELAELEFDDRSATALASIAYRQSLNGSMAAAEARSYDADEIIADPWAYTALLARIVLLKPSMIAFAMAMLKRFENDFDTKVYEQMLLGLLNLNGARTVDRAQALIAVEQPEPAVALLHEIIDAGDNSISTRIAYSQALSYAGRLDEALSIMAAIRKIVKSSPVYRESLRLCILVGDYGLALTLLEDAYARRIEVGDMLPRKVYFGARQPGKALKTFTEQRLTKTVQTYYRHKYARFDQIDAEWRKLFLIAVFGPGDEIRFASIYNLLPHVLPGVHLSISCDPRLQPMFERSFPHVEFVPVPRPRNSDRIDYADYSNVPGSDISYVMDNRAVEQIESVDRIMMVTDMLHVCLPDYDSFAGTAYLRIDNQLQEKFRARLPNAGGKLMVGLSWRSSLTTHSRNEHYLSIEELMPIFEVEGIQFVNLQYDECSAELAFVEARYPGKMVNFEDVNQYDDFDSVAAIMSCMDLVVAPATTVVELAGALGCRTWLLSNSSELHWRKVDTKGTDVWHQSLTHVEGSALGDKSSLVAELKRGLERLVEETETDLPKIA